jgi:hypothetical protein
MLHGSEKAAPVAARPLHPSCTPTHFPEPHAFTPNRDVLLTKTTEEPAVLHPPSATGLYWSIRGEVACNDHAPTVDDPRWTVEGWNPIPVSAGHTHARRYQCQFCAVDGRAIVRNVQTHSRPAISAHPTAGRSRECSRRQPPTLPCSTRQALTTPPRTRGVAALHTRTRAVVVRPRVIRVRFADPTAFAVTGRQLGNPLIPRQARLPLRHPVPDKTPCPRCGKIGFVRFENVIKGGNFVRVCYCGSCGHEWQVGAEGNSTTTEGKHDERDERPDRSRPISRKTR